MSTTLPDYWFDDTVKFGLSVVTHPTEEPVSVDEVKDNSRIDGTDHDEWIAEAIIEARELCEVYCKRRLVTTSLRLSLDHFPAGPFYVPSPPLQSVTSLKYYDTSGVQQTLVANTDYTVDTYTEPGRITPAYGTSWPACRGHTNDVELIFVAGYGDALKVKRQGRRAIKVAVGAWYENREGQGELPPEAIAELRSLSWGFLP